VEAFDRLRDSLWPVPTEAVCSGARGAACVPASRDLSSAPLFAAPRIPGDNRGGRIWTGDLAPPGRAAAEAKGRRCVP